MSLRVLWGAGSDEPIIEAIERNLAAAITENGGALLRLTESRRPDDSDIPTIDLLEAALVHPRPEPAPAPPAGFERMVADTHAIQHILNPGITREDVDSDLRRCAGHADLILERFRPDAVLVWNGLLGRRGVVALCAQARGVPVFYCERGMLPGTWYADPLGVNASSSLVRSPLAPGLGEALDTPLPPEDRQAVLDVLAATSRAGASAWGQPPLRGPDAWRKQLGIAAATRVLFFPLQVNADTNTVLFSPHFSGSVAALTAVADALNDREDWFLLVKPHPKGDYGPNEVEHATARAHAGRVVADINMHDALALASLVVTINSNAAAEAVWSGKPVLQLGQGILSGKDIVSEYAPGHPMLDQLRGAIEAWSNRSERFERALRFHRFLDQEYLLTIEDRDDTRRLVNRLDTLSPSAIQPPQSSAESLVREFTWQPAVELLDRLARRPSVRHVLLVGFGRNALRLLAAADRHPAARGLRWSAWDDNDAARRQAETKGLPLIDPWSPTISADDTLLVVTPRGGTALGRRLATHGYKTDDQWLYLIPPQ